MDPTAQKIQDALQVVSQFRQQHASDPALAQASTEIKRFQARRFEASYADLLHSPRYHTATAFFLHELYSDKDYAQRDHQFARIANTIARLFPQAVVNTTGALAEVHALTETLDDQMARCWLADASSAPKGNECDRYIRCWRRLGDRAARHYQLKVVLQLGQEMDCLTRMRGLQTLLKMLAPARPNWRINRADDGTKATRQCARPLIFLNRVAGVLSSQACAGAPEAMAECSAQHRKALSSA